MSTHLEDSDHIEDPNDDGQLTIRIPNPKVYMARQSQWIGRRGKPRCDHCRLGNLKCDRVLPMCNHCSWANQQECKYTPLPTPAHRGIPRCDRCRAANQKCDRNLPVCSNCSENAHGAACNYTPKKRHRRAGDDDGGTEGITKDPSKTGNEKSLKTEPEPFRSDHTFYGQNVATNITFPRHLTPTHSETESTSDPDSSHTGRFTANFAKSKHRSVSIAPVNTPDYPQVPAIVHSPPPQFEFVPHTFPASQKIIIHPTHIEPWTHASFIPLPDFVWKGLYQIDPVELPKRHEFEAALGAFQSSMMDVLRETAMLSMDKYIKVAHALRAGDSSSLSDRMHSWTAMHRLCSGSDKYSAILAPRDSVFSMDEATADDHRREFVAALLDGTADAEALQVYHYDRLPVQNQIYDILTWAHRNHLGAPQMLIEAVRLRFAFITWPMAEMYVRMCPLCTLRRKEIAAESYPPPLRAPVAAPTWGPYIPGSACK